MQLFYGTVTFSSNPVDTQDATVAKGIVASNSDKNIDTPVGIKAYGKAGMRLMNAKAGTRIQVVQGTLHRNKDYTYVINVIKYNMLPEKLDSTLYPDWHEVVIAGRTVKDLDKSDSRQYFNTDDFTVVKRGIAVNQGRDKVDFFDVSAFTAADSKYRMTDSITKYCASKGTFMMVRGTINSKRGLKANSEGIKPIFTDISVNQLFLGPKTEHSGSTNGNGSSYGSSNGHSSNGNGHATTFEPEAYQPAPVPGAQPQMTTDEELPF